MRWHDLFADLEAQARALEAGYLAAEVADRTRGENAQIDLHSRLRCRVGHPVTVHVAGAGVVAGRLTRMGADWLLLSAGEETVVATGALAAVVNLPPDASTSVGPSAGQLAGRVPLTVVLRAMARDRSVVRVVLLDGTVVTGTPDRVGRDFVDVAVHPSDEAPRLGQVRARWTVNRSAVATVSRR